MRPILRSYVTILPNGSLLSEYLLVDSSPYALFMISLLRICVCMYVCVLYIYI